MKTMTEHETTITVIRKDYMDRVLDFFRKSLSEDPNDKDCNYMRWYQWREDTGEDFLEKCTTLQLRALCILIDRGTKFKIVRSNPLDHLAVTFAGMYVGIEIDGHTHS